MIRKFFAIIRVGSPQPSNENIKNVHGLIEIMDKGQLIIDVNAVFYALFEIDKDEKKDYKSNPWLCDLKKHE